MRLYHNLDTKQLMRGFSNPEALPNGRVDITRGDSETLDNYFGRPFDTVGTDLGTVTSFKFGVKVDGDYDGSYVVSNYDSGTFVFTEVLSSGDTCYRVSPGWNTTKLNNLLGYDPSGFQEVTEIRAVADVSDSLDGKYFVLRDSAGSVGVWIDVDNSGTAAPAGATACTRQIEITTIVTGDSAATIATAIAAVLEADAAFTASATGSLITVTDAAVGARTAAADGNAGFTITRWITGSAPNSMTDVESVDLMAEVEYTVGGLVTSSLIFPLRVFNDLNKGSEGVPVLANPAYPAPANIPMIRLDIDTLTGGAVDALDSIVTIGINLATYPTLYIVLTGAGGGAQGWRLTSGTDAENSAAGIVRPDDYAASTNEKVWKLVF